MTPSPCPDRRDLDRFLRGTAPDAETIRRHLDGCTSCRDYLESLRANATLAEPGHTNGPVDATARAGVHDKAIPGGY